MSLLGLQRVGTGPVLVWLHGFTQTKDSAHEFLSILAGTYELLTIDLPGHGDNASVTASLDQTADLYDVTKDELVSHQLIRRVIDPAEIAAAIAFCASPAGGVVNGSILHADGGFSG